MPENSLLPVAVESTGVQSDTPQLLLENQLCFPLYAASRLMTRLYQTQLEPVGLTYPQYVVMMILWEEGPCSVSHIGRRAMLNSNTLTPLLKRLQQEGILLRRRDCNDERRVTISLTERGAALRQVCAGIPATLMGAASGLSTENLAQLKTLLDTLLLELVSNLDGGTSPAAASLAAGGC